MSTDFGFRLLSASDLEASWSLHNIMVRLSLDPRDWLLQGTITDGSNPSTPIPLEYFADQRAVGWQWPWQFKSRADATNELPRVARQLQPHFEKLLRNISLSYPLASRRSHADAEAITEKAELACTLARADEAWLRKDYPLVIRILTPIKSRLDESHLSRLRYALKKA